jgi:ABC-2 type transport system ATP-binding protein
VRLDAVGKRYGLRQPWIVRDVSQEVAAGQLIRVEGPNGSGKSTLLRVAAGVSMPSAGRVTGRPRAGYVPERFRGGMAFSAREYLQHMGRIHGLAGAAVATAVNEWLDRLGATDYAASPLRTLSKGMCQKVAIAQALMSRPGLLVLDEAWTGLDQAVRAALDLAVIERVAAGGTVLFVDHDPARLAAQVSQRWRLQGGRVSVVAGEHAAGADAGASADGGAGRDGAVEGGAAESGAAGGGVVAGGVVAGGVVAGGAAESGAAGGGVVAGRAGVVTIELAGLDAESVPQLARMSGVLGVSADRRSAAEPGRRPGTVQVAAVTVAATESDAVLRDLLSWDGVHVVAVRPGAERVR